MDRSKAPFVSQDPQEVSEVLEAMKTHQKRGGKGGFHCKKKTYDLGDGSGRTVDSWQMNDWDYKKPNLPTHARGLFTHYNNGKPEIAARGYDKFFNVDEVNKTKWRNVEENTRGPYELSVKENGCIIFIAGLDDGTILVTSKHSLGPRDNDSANHALAGEKWIDRQLAASGRSRGDLAKRLRSMNATAVAELCDDEFEEHVLEYKPEAAGLYLHGINLNVPIFATYPGNLVENFAEEWGFRKVMYTMEKNISKVKSFLDKVAETGNYAGRDTEGFVIRCQARDSLQGQWHDWFFKYKFDEPYLMYRQWRECTKAVIAGRAPQYKKHLKITKEYLAYAQRQLHKDLELGKRYNANHGIIAMRDGFLAEKGLKGSDIIRDELESDEQNQSHDVTRDVVLVPVATIGCGKTTVGLALSKLFGWGHEQNDNIAGKGRRPPRFTMACTSSMSIHPVVIADRNNHQRREREQIIHDIQEIVPDAKFVALHYVHDRGNFNAIRDAMRARVLSRGDNHQTIQAGSKSQDEITGIMDGFMKRFEPVDAQRSPDDNFDLVIDLDPSADSIDNLSTIVNALHREYPKLFKMPTDDKMESAINAALEGYKPDIKHDLGSNPKAKPNTPNPSTATTNPTPNNNKKQKTANPIKAAATQARQKQNQQTKPPRLEYFGITLPAPDILRILNAVFASESPNTAAFWNQLKATNRVQAAFHVTLIHRAAMAANGSYWTTLNELWHSKQRDAQNAYLPLSNASNGSSGSRRSSSGSANANLPTRDVIPDIELARTRVHLESVVWDGRVMAIAVRLPDADGDGFRSVNEVAHVTMGTANEGIKPKESNELLGRWNEGHGSDDGGVSEVKIKGLVVLEGVVKGVLSR